MQLSIILPACNEADNIAQTLDRVGFTLDRLRLSGEILVVDDGSTDLTAAIVQQRAAHEPRLRLLRHPRNQGYGAALRTGFQHALGALIFFTDADLQFDLSELEGLLLEIEEAVPPIDGVVGYREQRQDPRSRRWNARAWNALVQTLFRVQTRDINCAFKLFHRRVLERVVLSSSGAFINTELWVRAQHAGFVLREVPVCHYPRQQGRSSGARPDVVARAFLELVWLYRDLQPPPASIR